MQKWSKFFVSFVSGLSALDWNFQICAFASTDILKILCWETTFLLQDSFLLNQQEQSSESCAGPPIPFKILSVAFSILLTKQKPMTRMINLSGNMYALVSN